MSEKQENIENNQKSKKGKLVALIIIALIAIVLLVVGIVLAINANTPKSNVKIETTEDMENLINTVYEGLEQSLPGSLMTQAIDASDVNMVTAYTGLTSNENIDSIVASEPMMSSQAYSFVLVKVKDGVDANEIAKEMSEKVDTRKWICVEAEKLYATSVDNLAVLVMANDEWATPVYNKLLEVLGAHDEEYTKENTEAINDQEFIG